MHNIRLLSPKIMFVIEGYARREGVLIWVEGANGVK